MNGTQKWNELKRTSSVIFKTNSWVIDFYLQIYRNLKISFDIFAMEGYTKQWFVAINRVFHAYKFSWHCNILVIDEYIRKVKYNTSDNSDKWETMFLHSFYDVLTLMYWHYYKLILKQQMLMLKTLIIHSSFLFRRSWIQNETWLLPKISGARDMYIIRTCLILWRYYGPS